jgi:hypothetical protein
MAKPMRSHLPGQVWRPLKDDARYKISLTFCGYSVPMYCCYFCDDELLAACRSLDKAVHACEVMRTDRQQLLTNIKP